MQRIVLEVDGDMESGTTYYEVSIAVAMDFISDIEGPAAVFGDDSFAFVGRLEVPDGVWVFWVSEQLFCSQWCHDWWWWWWWCVCE